MTDTPKTVEELDEMRARAMAEFFPWEELLPEARAIRGADDKAGLAIVPKEATEEMADAARNEQQWSPELGPRIDIGQDRAKVNAAIAAGSIRVKK